MKESNWQIELCLTVASHPNTTVFDKIAGEQ